MKTKSLFIATAAIEAGAGLALLVSPALAVSALMGAPLDTLGGSVIGRVAGAALLALGVACWLARNDEHSRAAAGIVSALLFYNVVTVVVLAYAGIGLGLFGVGLWPAIALHGAMVVWCIACLLIKRS